MKLFGTDGIRARAGDFPLNATAIAAIGRAIGETLAGTLLVGQDTRLSSPWILDLLTRGITRSGASRIEAAGVIPTPAVALLTRSNSFAGGVMISASHNPFEDNGIKVFARDGTKLRDEVEAQIERRIVELLPNGGEEAKDVVPDTGGSLNHTTEWSERYQDLLLSHFPKGQWLKGMRILADCANGAMRVVGPAVLKPLGA